MLRKPCEREEDDLDRSRFAAEIVDVVIATPPDWSARIGIFAKWGEGKTTVLRFAGHMLEERGSIVFRFNPWAVQNWNDLWEDFGNRLAEALSTAGVAFDGSWKETAKNASNWLDSKGVGQATEAVASLFGRDKLYNAAFGALSRWLKYDGAQIRAIREKLKDRRLVVLIDDLDRCAPDLIPQLLLSLRELWLREAAQKMDKTHGAVTELTTYLPSLVRLGRDALFVAEVPPCCESTLSTS